MRFFHVCLLILLLSTSGCKTLGTGTASGPFEFVAPDRADCEKAVLLQTYLSTSIDCVDPASLLGEAPRRALSTWIPCNDVERIDGSVDLFGSSDQDTPTFVATSKTTRIAQGQNLVMETSHAKKLRELLAKAETSIIVDMNLFGGQWGRELLKDLFAASKRGVTVVFLHDASSAITAQTKAIWTAAKKQSAVDPHFLALETEGPTAGKIVLGEVHSYSDMQGKRSSADRSRIILMDTLFKESLAEFLQAVPKALVGSRSTADSSAASHDETVLVQGPLALAATLAYLPDIRKAGTKAKFTEADKKEYEGLLQKLDRMNQGPTLVAGQGWVSVEPMESTDYRTNADSTILTRLMAATSSIDIYGANVEANWPLAQALVDAQARGVQVRILLDLKNRATALGNASMATMLLANSSSAEESLPIRWFVPLAHKTGGLNAKTIIVDGRWSLYGSTDFDSYGWGGSVRSYSVWVDDPALAAQAAEVFDRIWQSPLLTVSHKTWLENKDYSPELLQTMALVNHSDADKEKAFLKGVTAGAGYMQDKQKKRLAVVTPKALESLRRPFPSMIPLNGDKIPQCVDRLDAFR